MEYADRMGVRADLLTWQGVRSLAQIEAVTLGRELAMVAMDTSKPPLKLDPDAWMQTAVHQMPVAGDIVYARMAWRHPWRNQLVDQVTVPIVMVGHFYDPSIKAMAVDTLLRPGSPVQHWFGVQADVAHPKLTVMPLGVEPAMVPVLQAAEIRAEKDIDLYLNFQTVRVFHFPTGGSHSMVDAPRTQLWQHFAGRDWVTADPFNEADPAHYARQLGRAKFVLSPPRWGWDCYRTYEAIAMGAIPIVQRKRPTTDHLEALPVLLVDHWSEVTRARLQREWDQRREHDLSLLTMSYWQRRIRMEAAKAVEECAA